MKQLTEEQLLGNWKKLLQLVEDTFEGERKEKLLEMYEFFEDRMVVAPASGKEEYHYCYAGGYVNHVLHVCETALEVSKTYEKVGGYKDWTDEEISQMAEIAYNLPHMWRHAIGDDWQDKWTREDIEALYRRL